MPAKKADAQHAPKRGGDQSDKDSKWVKVLVKEVLEQVTTDVVEELVKFNSTQEVQKLNKLIILQITKEIISKEIDKSKNVVRSRLAHPSAPPSSTKVGENPEKAGGSGPKAKR